MFSFIYFVIALLVVLLLCISEHTLIGFPQKGRYRKLLTFALQVIDVTQLAAVLVAAISLSNILASIFLQHMNLFVFGRFIIISIVLLVAFESAWQHVRT